MIVLMIRRPPSSPLFPYTTLLRSVHASTGQHERGRLPDPGILERTTQGGGPAQRASAAAAGAGIEFARSEEHTSELQSRRDLVCRLLLEKKNNDLLGLMLTGVPVP